MSNARYQALLDKLQRIDEALGLSTDLAVELVSCGLYDPQPSVDRLRAELACERGETHKPDGAPWPWAERGWRWGLGAWWKDSGWVNLHAGQLLHSSESLPDVGWLATPDGSGRPFAHGAHRGALPAIEAAEAWLAKQEAP